MAEGALAPSVTRIHPPGEGARSIDARAAYADLDFAALALERRPYTVVNMVATVDGQGRIGQNTAELGGAADGALFATLRERVDCVMAGTATIAAERYNAPARSPEVQRRRVEAGLTARPHVAMITRSGRLPTEAPLFADPDLHVVAFGGDQAVAAGLAAQVDCPEVIDPVDVALSLRRDHGVRSLLLEGGPRINTPFFAAELVDELFLTVAPLLTGANDPFPIIAGALPTVQKLHLIGALTGEDHLFLRYRVD